MAINIQGTGFNVRNRQTSHQSFICLDICTCAITDLSFKGDVSFKASLYASFFLTIYAMTPLPFFPMLIAGKL